MRLWVVVVVALPDKSLLALHSEVPMEVLWLVAV